MKAVKYVQRNRLGDAFANIGWFTQIGVLLAYLVFALLGHSALGVYICVGPALAGTVLFLLAMASMDNLHHWRSTLGFGATSVSALVGLLLGAATWPWVGLVVGFVLFVGGMAVVPKLQ